MARAASRPLVAAPEGPQVRETQTDGPGPGARPGRPDRRASSAFAQSGPVSFSSSTAVVRWLSHSDPDGAGRSGAGDDPARPWGTDANGARLKLGAGPNLGHWRPVSSGELIGVARD